MCQEGFFDEETRSRGFIREIDDGDVTAYAKNASDDAFLSRVSENGLCEVKFSTHDYKNPPPSIQSSKTFHLAQSQREDVREARGEKGQEVKGREALLNFETDIPATTSLSVMQR